MNDQKISKFDDPNFNVFAPQKTAELAFDEFFMAPADKLANAVATRWLDEYFVAYLFHMPGADEDYAPPPEAEEYADWEGGEYFAFVMRSDEKGWQCTDEMVGPFKSIKHFLKAKTSQNFW